MGISVLISAYINCKKEYISQALESIWCDQILKPDQIVLVLDGPVEDDLYDFVYYFSCKIYPYMVVVQLECSYGFANALNKGLKYCEHEYIARMDSDDISLPARFLLQNNFLNENPSVDVVGSWISEIDSLDNLIRDEVKYPKNNSDCFDLFSYRDPLAHPVVMFRRRFFDKVKMYPLSIKLAEDTLLWYEGFKLSCVFSNLQVVTLKYRRPRNFFNKRANFKKSILLLYWRLFIINRVLQYGFKADVLAVLYFFMNYLPGFVKKFLYNKLR